MFPEAFKKRLIKQQYRIVGRHSAVKPCTWTKHSIRKKGVCYKEKFYGIKSHRCVQMTTYLACANFCVFCWRDISAKAHQKFEGIPDEPKLIVDNAIEAHKKLLIGFKDHVHIDKQKYEEAQSPKHLAISLVGEPVLYPKLQELIDYAHSAGLSTFVVCSGQFPEQMADIRPTQLYLSVDAADKESFDRIDKPTFKDGWERLLKSLDVLKEAREKNNTRTALRLTMIKGMNSDKSYAEKYAGLIKRASPLFVEVKGYMFIGSSRQRLQLSNMPRHAEIVEFGKELEKFLDYKIVDGQEESRVILMMKKEDLPLKKIEFNKK